MQVAQSANAIAHQVRAAFASTSGLSFNLQDNLVPASRGRGGSRGSGRGGGSGRGRGQESNNLYCFNVILLNPGQSSIPFFYGCCLMVAWWPEASTICSWVTKILNIEPCPTWWIAKGYDSYGNSLYVSFQRRNNSSFPAHFILLKQKSNTLVCLPWAKNFHR